MKTSRDVYVIAGSRTPFTKSFGHYRSVTTQALMSASLQNLVKKTNLTGELVGDVAFGAVINSSSNWNMTRECVLESGLHPWTPGYNVQRACGTSLDTTWQLALKIAAGQMDCAIAGGVDTNSDLPVLFRRSFSQKLLKLRDAKGVAGKIAAALSFGPADFKPVVPGVVEPRTGLSMGQHCEKMVQEWKISREEQDALALRSHVNGAKAYARGFYKDMIFPFQNLEKDTILRGDTTLEKLGKLKPAFAPPPVGTLTAGNSSPLTDGSACVLLASEEKAKQKGWKTLARLKDFEVAAVNFVKGDGLLMAPTIAVSRLLARNNLKLQDFDFYEIHEAFAGQVLCTLKAWQDPKYCRDVLQRSEPMGEIDFNKMNVVGSSVALGHPFAATGARIVATLAHLLNEKGSGRGLISICTAGGMGVTAILEK